MKHNKIHAVYTEFPQKYGIKTECVGVFLTIKEAAAARSALIKRGFYGTIRIVSAPIPR